jgi:hypothetical protein
MTWICALQIHVILAVQHLWAGILLLIDEQSAVKVFGLYKLDIYLVLLDGFLEGEGLSVGMKFQRVTIGYILKVSSPCNLKDIKLMPMRMS